MALNHTSVNDYTLITKKTTRLIFHDVSDSTTDTPWNQVMISKTAMNNIKQGICRILKLLVTLGFSCVREFLPN